MRKTTSARRGSFPHLVDAAEAKTLRELLIHLATSYPDIQRDCIDFLVNATPVDPAVQRRAASEVAFSLWAEVELNLGRLIACGFDEEAEDRAATLIADLTERAEGGLLSRNDRRALLTDVVSSLDSDNAALDDALLALAHAACYDNDDLRNLAGLLEKLDFWYVDHACRIYRQIGDRRNFLRLRTEQLQDGGDYHDLATFYWEAGEREQALNVAREGMQKATGRMHELRAFLVDRALEDGDRPAYVALQFAQTTDGLTPEGYTAFKNLCDTAEWSAYEPRLLAAVQRSSPRTRLEIHMLRGEHDQAVALLRKERYWEGDTTVRVAAQLEERYPEQILAFYQSGLEGLNAPGSRANYRRNALVALKLRHMWMDVLKTPGLWREFARRTKALNQRRPAFQEEWARVIPDWGSV